MKWPRLDYGGGTFATLTHGREYSVIEIDGLHYRIEEDGGDPALYPVELFDIIEPAVRPQWIARAVDDRIILSFPEFQSVRYFWTKWFDDDAECKRIYAEAKQKYRF